MATNDETMKLTVQCLCKAHTFNTLIPRSKLPLEASVCHCGTCRHSTGALYSSDGPWPEPRQKMDTSKLKIFHFGPTVDLLFCGTCSTPMFFANPKDPEKQLDVFMGIIGDVDGERVDVVKITHHIFVGDTKDGGASVWMRRVNRDGSEATRHHERLIERGVSEYPDDWPQINGLEAYHSKTEDSVTIQCKCKGVSFIWNRRDYTAVEKENLPWCIDPATLKPLAASCACNSCRISSGAYIWNFAVSEPKNLLFSTSSSAPFPETTPALKELVDAKDPSIGTLTYYASSPKVQRYFCSRCSACVFYATDDRPELVDIAMGLVIARDGARAEGFVSWDYGSASHREDVAGSWRGALVEKMINESEEWRVTRGYPKCWVREKAESDKKAVE